MFSGIVEEIGTVAALDRGASEPSLTVRCRTVIEGTRVGDSISVNGVCLTVTSLRDDAFVVGLQPVTLRLTNLGDLQPGDGVNLERSLAVGDRIGGHYVQGHVDATGRVVSMRHEGASVIVRLSAPPELHRYIVQRGFIAVDGVSLTVMEVFPDGFSVSLVRHTQEHITLARQRPGYRANLEVDVIARYVESLLSSQHDRSGIDLDLLRRTGFA